MKKYWKIAVLIICFIISLLFIIPVVTHNIVSFMCSNGYLKPGSENQWIGFYGAVIGGALTLLGVWWTIRDQNQKRKKDFMILNKPIIIISKIEFIGNANDIINNLLEFKFDIKNIGNSEALNIEIFVHLPTHYGNDNCALCSPKFFNILLSSQQTSIKALGMKLKKYTSVVGEAFEIIINYQDLLGEHYNMKQIVYFDRSRIMENDDKLSNVTFKQDELKYGSELIYFPEVHKNL